MHIMQNINNPALQKSMQFLQKANECEQGKNYQKALLFYQAAINTCPLNAAPYVGVLKMLTPMGEIEAAAKLVALMPEVLLGRSPQLQFLVGILRLEQNDFDGAIALLEPLLHVASLNQPSLCNNLGACYSRQEKYEQALEYYRRAVAGGEGEPQYWLNLAGTYQKMARMAEAFSVYEKGVERHPRDSDLLYEYGNCLLKAGEYEEGFEFYRNRWEAAGFPATRPAIALPEWSPDSKDGKLFVLAEQGLGDQILYAALTPYLTERVGNVTVSCDARLIGLFGRSFPGVEFVDVRSYELSQIAGNFDSVIPMGDLGRYAWGEIGTRSPYLQPDRDRTASLRERYRQMFPGKKLVGISWRSKRAVYGEKKTVEIPEWAPVLKRADTQFVCLQYGDVGKDLAQARTQLGVDIYKDPDIDTMNDIDGVAAQARALDLVITTSNTNAHVAAATGAPTWIILPTGAGLLWYWGYRGASVDWYPGVRVYRASEVGAWGDVMDNVARELNVFLDESSDDR